MNGCTFKKRYRSGRIVWGYIIDAGKDANGKRVQFSKVGFESKKGADDAKRIALNERADGNLVKADPQSFGAFAEEWFREYAHRGRTPKTVERYQELTDYIVPHIGHVKLQELTPLMLERVLNRLKDSGGRDRRTKKPRPLSDKTVREIANVVNQILMKAIKHKLLKSNPMHDVELPPKPVYEARALDSDRVQRYIDAARRHGVYALLMFYAGTATRRGEALALRRSEDLDLDAVPAVVRVSRSLEQTKQGLRVKGTKKNRSKVITLSASLVEVLKSHLEHQDENRRLFGPKYRTDLDLVFCAPDGNYLKPDSVTAKGCLISREADLGKGVSLHTFRHSHASQMLSDGVPLHVVSKRLGHTNVTTTANIYAHLLPTDDEKAAELWDNAFMKAASKANSKVITMPSKAEQNPERDARAKAKSK